MRCLRDGEKLGAMDKTQTPITATVGLSHAHYYIKLLVLSERIRLMILILGQR
jgi:hypothetical protein